MDKKIKFKDLSGWLKIAIILSWITGGYYLFWFLVGFIEGLLGI
jgi:hypothetical protein